MKAACWLMNRFGVSDEVCGDIVEHCAAGRSSLWLWRQAVAAVGTALLEDIRSRPVDVAGTLFIGLLLVSAATWVFHATGRSLENWIGEVVVDHVQVSLLMHIPLVGLITALIRVPAWLAIGCLFASFHRTRIVLLLLIIAGVQSSPHYVRQIYHAVSEPAFHQQGVLFSLLTIEALTFSVGTLAGALWVKRRIA